MDDAIRTRLDAIRAQAVIEPDGWVASANGRDPDPIDRQPHILTYYATCPPKIAASPAAIVERADVLWLIERVERAHDLLTRAAAKAAALLADYRSGAAIRVEDGVIVVDAEWENRLMALDAMLTTPGRGPKEDG